ncbi:MAG: LysR family transcriptional regulator [Clostridia bacterium]|nr:LysR family transcriptional regulator [Clostridia bacterium]
MELLQLQYFYDTSKTENFAKTAEKYLVPPSSVSASVKRLEKELGCRLFDRHANRILLNENGRMLQSHLCLVFEELEQAKSKLNPNGERNTQINILVRSLRHSLTNAIIRYRGLHPEVTFCMDFDLDQIDANNYDLIIDERNDNLCEMKRMELCSTRIYIHASSSNPLCGRTLTMSQLSHQPFVTMGKNSNLYKILLRACKSTGFTPNVVVETNDSNCYARCIAEGIGIGLSRTKNPGSPNTQTLFITDFDERQTFYLYYRQDEKKRSIIEFIEFLKSWDF